MKELEELKNRLESQRPAAWEDLPDLSLYMDQVIEYMPRQLIRYGEEERLTSAMVNNYIKDGLLPRAEGKRYGKEHLAYLTVICALKQVMPVRDAGLLAVPEEGQEIRTSYEEFRSQLDRALSEAAESMDPSLSQEDLPRLALSLALRGYADRLACQRILDVIRQGMPTADQKSRKKESKAHA